VAPGGGDKNVSVPMGAMQTGKNQHRTTDRSKDQLQQAQHFQLDDSKSTGLGAGAGSWTPGGAAQPGAASGGGTTGGAPTGGGATTPRK
jgi:hypothetical protein